MCEEPKTITEAADRHWFTVGLDGIQSITSFALEQKGVVTDAFMSGAEWERARQRKLEAAKVPSSEPPAS